MSLIVSNPGRSEFWRILGTLGFASNLVGNRVHPAGVWRGNNKFGGCCFVFSSLRGLVLGCRWFACEREPAPGVPFDVLDFENLVPKFLDIENLRYRKSEILQISDFENLISKI